MYRKLIIIFLLFFSIVSCSKNEDLTYEPQKKLDPYIIYHHKANIIFRENDIAITI